MTIPTALQLVIELAEQNQLEQRETLGDPALVREMERQERAIKTTRRLLKSLRFFKPAKKG